jgi:predicted alpha/beta superfamily hydrolase
MKKLALLALLFVVQISLFGQASSPFCIGESFSIQSSHLNETRTIHIYTPYSGDSTLRKPEQIIYLLDASKNEDFIHVAGLLQFFELQFQIPPTLIVGIANVDRKRDFTFPTEDKELKEAFPTTGGSATFIEFIKAELKPEITQRFGSFKKEIIIGQSLGGLLASEILLKHPDLFSDYLIISPSLWWDNESLLEEAPERIKKIKNKNAIISVGKEGRIMVNDAKKLNKLLTKNKAINTHLNYFPKENHATILHNALYRSFMEMMVRKNDTKP